MELPNEPQTPIAAFWLNPPCVTRTGVRRQNVIRSGQAASRRRSGESLAAWGAWGGHNSIRMYTGH